MPSNKGSPVIQVPCHFSRVYRPMALDAYGVAFWDFGIPVGVTSLTSQKKLQKDLSKRPARFFKPPAVRA